MTSRMGYVSSLFLLLMGVLALAGCGGGGGSTGGTASATFVLTADTSGARDAGLVSVRGVDGPVPVEDIESLVVTVTEITLQRCCDDEQDDEETEGEGEGVSGRGIDDVETVLVEDFAFDPTTVEVDAGGTVRWVWTTNTLHTITSGLIGDLDAGSEFDESADVAGTVIELVFESPGEYPYFSNTDTDISEAMTGVVRVEEEDGDDDGDDCGDDQNGGHVTVYEGSFDVDILDLTELSEVLTMVEIPAGEYCRIIINIENARLVLAADPGTEITDVHLTANGRLFIKDHFELEDGEQVLIVLNFGSIHLVDAGSSGQYVLTPQLRADVEVEEAETSLEGEIVSKNEETMIIEVDTEGDAPPVEVLVDLETVIKTDDDSDDEARGEEGEDPTVLLTFADLAVGQEVEVEGLLTVGGQLLADEIEVEDDDFDTEAAPV